MKTYKRALSNAQAAACESAKHPKCRCRCSGALHGKSHQGLIKAEAAFKEQNNTKTITQDDLDLIIHEIKRKEILQLPLIEGI